MATPKPSMATTTVERIAVFRKHYPELRHEHPMHRACAIVTLAIPMLAEIAELASGNHAARTLTKSQLHIPRELERMDMNAVSSMLEAEATELAATGDYMSSEMLGWIVYRLREAVERGTRLDLGVESSVRSLIQRATAWRNAQTALFFVRQTQFEMEPEESP